MNKTYVMWWTFDQPIPPLPLLKDMYISYIAKNHSIHAELLIMSHQFSVIQASYCLYFVRLPFRIVMSAFVYLFTTYIRRPHIRIRMLTLLQHLHDPSLTKPPPPLPPTFPIPFLYFLSEEYILRIYTYTKLLLPIHTLYSV